jgi:Receptor family ligand binding region
MMMMTMRLWYVLLLFAVAGQGITAQNMSGTMCGLDTQLDTSTNQCVCKAMDGATNGEDNPSNNTGKIYIAGIFDLDAFDWGPDIFEYTVKLINEGHWDIFVPPSGNGGAGDQQQQQQLVYALKNEACDDTTAVRGYWDLRTQNGNKPMDGIIGCRCSGPSISLARISGLEKVPQISPTSNSAKLNTREFPYFSRLVAPNNEQGEVGAIVALLRAFDWERVTILGTDTEYARVSYTCCFEFIHSATRFGTLIGGSHHPPFSVCRIS